MRLQLLLAKVEPKEIREPGEGVYDGCGSKQLHLHQQVQKALRDTMHQQVEAHRYRCLKCGRTFRVYPAGVSQAQTSDRVKGLAVMLYLLGLSYGAVALALESLRVLSTCWLKQSILLSYNEERSWKTRRDWRRVVITQPVLLQ